MNDMQWPCGHYKQLTSDGRRATGCAICAAQCPRCGKSAGRECRAPAGYTTRTHSQRFVAAGLTWEVYA